MYSGLLPKGLTEDDLSSDDEEERGGSVVEAQPSHAAPDAGSVSPTCSMPGTSQEMWQVC